MSKTKKDVEATVSLSEFPESNGYWLLVHLDNNIPSNTELYYIMNDWCVSVDKGTSTMISALYELINVVFINLGEDLFKVADLPIKTDDWTEYDKEEVL